MAGVGPAARAWHRRDHLTKDDVCGNPERWRIYAPTTEAAGTRLTGEFIVRDPALGGLGIATTADDLDRNPGMYARLPDYVATTLRQLVARYRTEQMLGRLGHGS